MLRDEEQRLLPAHRASERVDAVRVDVHAEVLDDLRHPGEIGDLARVAPRVLVQPPSLAAGIDDREVALAGQVAPEPGVVAGAHPAAVRRDDERDRAAVVGRRAATARPGGPGRRARGSGSGSPSSQDAAASCAVATGMRTANATSPISHFTRANGKAETAKMRL